jgi:hypothetical protein
MFRANFRRGTAVSFGVGALLAAALLVAAPAVHGHQSNSDGGPAKRACAVLKGVSEYGPVGVGGTKVGCKVANRIARKAVRGKQPRKWRCTGRGTRFGHCHNRNNGKRIVHWYAYH